MSDRPTSTTLSRPRSKNHRRQGKDIDRSGTFTLKQLTQMTLEQLGKVAHTLEIDVDEDIREQDLRFKILASQAERLGLLFYEGVIEVLPDGYGFLRSAEHDYLQGTDDVFVPPALVRMFGIMTGDTVSGQVRSPRTDERYFTLTRIEAVNFQPPDVSRQRTKFDDLTPVYPDRMLHLETDASNLSGRAIDLFVPIGMGQRGLIVSPPRTGKTMLLQAIAAGIAHNHPDVYLLVLLIDERPEEVTDMQRSVHGRVIKSTFDEPATRHVQVAEMVIEEAKRWVEYGKDVVILLDSITRLARAYNSVAPQSGRVLSGGIDSTALQRPKRFFGTARNVEEGGSLTILATALIDTGSRMDDVIFEEFKGTGNMEIVLDRTLADRRVWPAIDLHLSGTRKEDLIIDPNDLEQVHKLRRALASMSPPEAMQLLADKLRSTATNAEFLASIDSSIAKAS